MGAHTRRWLLALVDSSCTTACVLVAVQLWQCLVDLCNPSTAYAWCHRLLACLPPLSGHPTGSLACAWRAMHARLHAWPSKQGTTHARSTNADELLPTSPLSHATLSRVHSYIRCAHNADQVIVDQALAVFVVSPWPNHCLLGASPQ
jgi:hypothetical protein